MQSCRAATIINPPRPSEYIPDHRRLPIQIVTLDTTKTGLTVRCELDINTYEKGIAVSEPKWQPSTSKATSSIPSGITASSPVPAKPRAEALISRSLLEIDRAVGVVVGKHKVAKHFQIEIGEAQFAFRRKPDAIAREARLDGVYVVRTSVPAAALDADETVQG